MNENFESLFDIIESWQQSRAGIRKRAMEWVGSEDFVCTYYDNAHVPPNARAVLREGMGKKEAESTWSKVRDFGVQNADLFQKYRALARSGEIVFGHLVIANPGLRSMPEKNLPCLMTVSHDQDSASVATAGILASALADLYTFDDRAEPRPKTLQLLRDDDFHLFRRRPLPLNEVNGFPVMLLDVLIRKSWLPPVEFPFIPLLISSETGGAVVQIPWYVVMGEPPTSGDLETGIWHEIAELDRSPKSRVPKVASSAPAGNAAHSRGGKAVPARAKSQFSIRLFLLRFVSVLVFFGIVAQLLFIFLMESKSFEGGILGAYQEFVLASHEISSWEALTPADFGMLAGGRMFPLVFSILALIAAFRCMRKMSFFSHLLLTVSGFGGGYFPLGPLAGLLLSLLPGRTAAWKKN